MDPELKNEQIIPKTDTPESVNSAENKETTWNKQNKIYQALENKFPGENNKSKRQELSQLFKNIEGKFDEETITKYIDTIRSINLLKVLRKPEEIREKYLIDEIDQQNNTIIYNTLEETDTQLEETDTQLEETDTQLGQKTTIKIETIKLSEENKILLEQAEKDYSQLLKDKPELKPEQKELDKQKDLLDQDGTLKQLKNKGLSEEQINDYVTFNYTYTHHQDELKDTEFGKSYKELQKSLNLEEKLGQPRSIGDLTNNKTVDSAIQNTPSLNNYSQSIDLGNNTSSKQYESQRENLTKLEKPDEIKKQFEDKENQNLIQKYQNILPKEPEENQNQTKEQNEQQQLQRKKNILIQVNDLNQNTQDILQKRILGSAISGLAGYFDFSTAQKESIENDFKIENGFDIQNNIFSLKGNVNGKNINVAYDLGNGNLSVEDNLFQEKNQNVIRIGQNKLQNLNIQLPSINILKDKALNIGKQEISEDKPEDYIKNLENNLHEELTSNFRGNQEIVKVRLERAVQKNLAVQETLNNVSNIISPDGQNIFNNQEFGQETTDTNLFKLMQTIDNSLENYSISEIENRRKNISIITKFIDTSVNDQSPDNRFNEIFQKKFTTNPEKNNEENKNTKVENIYKIIDSLSITKNSKQVVDLDNFNKLTDQLENTLPDVSKLSENTQKLFDPTEENPDILLAKRPEQK